MFPSVVRLQQQIIHQKIGKCEEEKLHRHVFCPPSIRTAPSACVVLCYCFVIITESRRHCNLYQSVLERTKYVALPFVTSLHFNAASRFHVASLEPFRTNQYGHCRLVALKWARMEKPLSAWNRHGKVHTGEHIKLGMQNIYEEAKENKNEACWLGSLYITF